MPKPPSRPRRPSIVVRIKNYLKGQQSPKPAPIDTSLVNNLNGTMPSSIDPSGNDTSQQNSSTTDTVSTAEQLKDWTYDDVQDFIQMHHFEKFEPILSEADGNYLFRLYSMSRESDNKLIAYMKEENPHIKLSDYLRFIKALEDCVNVKEANTNN